MIKVLVIDDSAVVRRVLSAELDRAVDIDVVGTAVDPYIAREKITSLNPDVVTLDLEMPRMGGLAFLAKLMKYHPMPVVVVSSLTPAGSEAAVRALQLGAVDVVPKPGNGQSLSQITQELVDKIRAARAAGAAVRRKGEGAPAATGATPRPAAAIGPARKIVAVGASTGGTEAIKELLLGMPADGPAMVIVQHMPERFTATFANRLNELCLMHVREASNGDEVAPGTALIAPGDRHTTLRRNGDGFSVEVKDGPKVLHQRPSVDVLFHSVATQAGPRAVGVILTGMGRDGANGMLAMQQAGAYTFAQDEDTCVVYGMPKEAVKLDAVDNIVALPKMPGLVLRAAAQAPTRQTTPAPS